MRPNWSHHTRWLIQQLADTRDAYTRAHQIPEARPYDITGHVRYMSAELATRFRLLSSRGSEMKLTIDRGDVVNSTVSGCIMFAN